MYSGHGEHYRDGDPQLPATVRVSAAVRVPVCVGGQPIFVSFIYFCGHYEKLTFLQMCPGHAKRYRYADP